MSVVFVIVPSMVGGWPILMAAIAAACSALGYQVLKGGKVRTSVAEVGKSVSMTLDAQALSDALEREETVTVVQSDVTISFHKDPRGRVTMHVSGKDKTEAELQEIGQKVMNRILQQYAYQRVMQELEKRGFTLIKEEF